MLLDRLLDSVGLEVVPAAVCNVRQGVRLELPPPTDPHVLCVVRGEGVLRTAAGVELVLGPSTLVIVPAHTAHDVTPEGGATRVLKLGSASGSDHVPVLTAGAGELGLQLVCGRIRMNQPHALGLFDGLRAPVAVALSDAPRAQLLFESLLDEQADRAPGNRRMTGLLMQQCLMHLLRKLCREADCPLPWLCAVRDGGLGRALEAILRAPAAPHSVKSLAAAAGMSRSSFSTRFAHAFGHTPMDWLRQTRVHEAMKLLRTTDLPIESVAARVGLTTGSSLFRQLRAVHDYERAGLDPTSVGVGLHASRHAARGYPPGRARSSGAEPKSSRSAS